MAGARAGASSNPEIAVAREVGSFGAHTTPPPVASTSSGNAPRPGSTTGTPAAMASITYNPKASPYRVGTENTDRDRKKSNFSARFRFGQNSTSPSKLFSFKRSRREFTNGSSAGPQP